MKKLLIRVIILVILIVTVQTVIMQRFPHLYWEQTAQEIKNFRAATKEHIDILYFGDSVLNSTYTDEPEKDSVTTYFEKELPSKHVVPISHAAYDVSIYQDYINYLISNSIKPDFIVIPINLRSFSPKWYLRPDWQFEKETWELRYSSVWPISIMARPLNVFKFFDWKTISKNKYENSPVFFKGEKVGLVSEYSEILESKELENQTKKLFQVIYLTDMDKNNPKIIALKNVAQLLKKNKMKAIFYITPIDFQSGINYWGEDFSAITQGKIALVKSVLSSQDQTLLDYSMLLPSENFYWRKEKTLNEHLLSNGRKILSASVAAEIKSAISLTGVSVN